MPAFYAGGARGNGPGGRQDKFEWVGFGICLAGCLAAALGSVFVGASVLSRGKEKREPDDAPPAD